MTSLKKHLHITIVLLLNLLTACIGLPAIQSSLKQTAATVSVSEPKNVNISGQLKSATPRNSLGTTTVRLEGSSSTFADGQGKFILKDVPSDSVHHLEAHTTQSDGTRFNLRTPIQATSPSIDLKTLLLTESGSVYGRITAKGMTNLIGINVFIAGSPMGALTDAEGNYFLANVPEGIYVVTAKAEGFQPVQGTVKVESGKPAQLSLALETRLADSAGFASVSGQVSSSAGPVAGVSVSITGESYAAITDQDGRYRLSNVLPGEKYRLLIQREGFLLQDQALVLKTGEQVVKDIQLKANPDEPTGTLKGVLRDAEGKPVAGATIETIPPTRTVTSDAEGRFEFPAMLPGSYYLTGKVDGQVKASRFVGLDPGQTVDTTVKGPAIVNNGNQACAQQNNNNININIPGAEVTVTVNNQNTCTVGAKN